MSLDEAIDRYIEKFGGFPYFNTMGMPDSEIIKKIEVALKTEEEIKSVEGRDY